MSDKTIWQTGLTESKSTDVEGVGRIRWVGDKAYRWVKNTNASAITVGMVVGHDFSDGDDYMGQVDLPATADLGGLAGVVVSTSIATLEFGWVQCHGYNATCKVFQSQTTVKTAGDFLLGVNAQSYVDADVTMGTAPKHHRNIQLLEAVTTVTTGAAANKKVYINCL